MAEMNPECRKHATEWCEYDHHPGSKATVQKWLEEGNAEAINSHFRKRITFGTAGLRGSMAPGIAHMNELVVLQTTQGIVKHLESCEDPEAIKQKGVVLGFDHRNNSLEFARTALAVLLGAGFQVYTFKDIVPTPFVPFAIGLYGCHAGIMVTASHNPKQDNGFKVFWENTAQIVSPLDKQIAAKIQENLKPWEAYSMKEEVLFANKRCKTVDDEVSREYTTKGCTLSRPVAKGGEKLRAVYSAMHGSGQPHVLKMVEAFGLGDSVVLNTVKEQGERDPEFSTVSFPNPEEKGAFDLSMKLADETGSILCLANDPDADRLAVATKEGDKWHTLTGNETALLFADWVWSHTEKAKGGKKQYMMASTASSKILRKMGQVEGFEFEETLTGFKWMGNKSAEVLKNGDEVLFAYEVEIGFLIGTMSLDKDGVRTLPVFLELTLHLLRQGRTLMQHLDSLYQKYGYHVMVNSYFFCHDPALMASIFDDIQALYRTEMPFTIAARDQQFRVVGVRDLRNGYDSTTPDNKPMLPADPFMVSFAFEGGHTCTVRGSGTEPKLKYYTEVQAADRATAEGISPVLTEAIIDAFIKPGKHGLKSTQ